jgi:hypothetical protein
VRLVPANSTSRLGWMRGLSKTVEGVSAWPHSCPQVVTISLWRWRINPPFLQDIACSVVNLSPHPSQCGGMAVGSSPKRRWIPSLNSSADRSEPFRRLGRVVSQAPVDADRFMRRLAVGGFA